MLRRPKATDTEEDLLTLQESFLASRELPSAFLGSQQATTSKKKVQVGEKRDHGEEMVVDETVLERDVVQLHPQGTIPTMESGRPPVKRSRFKEQRERAKVQEAPEDPFTEMECRDTHITKVLADIQEREGFSTTPVVMPTRMTKKGFPTVHELDSSYLSALPADTEKTDPSLPPTGRGVAKPPKKKKSLFAQQLERHGLEYFGIEVNEEVAGVFQQSQPTFKKDFVQPVAIVGGVSSTVTMRDKLMDQEHSDIAAATGIVQDMEVEDGEGVAREEFESDASQTWKRFLESNLISGEGLVSVGVSSDAAKDEVTKIHRENVERLSGVSEEEIIKEKQRIEQSLSPEMLAFLKKKRRGQKLGSQSAGDGGGGVDISERSPITGASLDRTMDGHEGEKDADHLEPSLPGRWLHMDVVEKEKMEWMTDVPLYAQNRSDEEEPREVRFSLEGLVIPRNVVLPAHLGLHHHGDEPQAAGYTLTELLPLCRSTVLQQRVLALNVLARITQRARHSEYVGVIEGSVVGKLLEAGVPMLLRYALDDSNDAVFYVAVHALHSLLVSTLEEHLLDNYCHCYHGYLLPALKSPDPPPGDCDEEEGKETDTEMLQRDIVEGLLSMQLLHRLRYIIEVCRPPALTVTEVLEILVRVARHSLSAADQVVKCPRLMKVIFDEFLPLSWSWDEGEAEGTDKEKVAHGRPQVTAVKLLLAICSAGRNLTAHLASHYQLLSVLTRYTVLHPTELNLPREEAYKLAISSLQTWTAALSYTTGDSAFRDTYPVFLRQLQQLSSLSGGPHSLGQLESRRVSALLGLVRTAIDVAAVTPDQLKTDKENVTLSPPAVEWSHASGMLTPLLQCLNQWVEQTTTGATQVERITCMGSLLHCLATYFESVTQKSPGDSLTVLEMVEKLADGVLSKLAKSALLSYSLEALRKISVLSTGRGGGTSAPRSPPSLSSHLHLSPPPKRPLYKQPSMSGNDFVEYLQPRVVCFTCANLVLGYVRLCLISCQLHKGIVSKIVLIFQNAAFMDYLDGVAQSTGNVGSCFEFIEMSLLCHAVELFTIWLELSERSRIEDSMIQLFHHIAFKLISMLPPGMEGYVHDLISRTVFYPAMFRDSSSSLLIEKDVTTLSLHDPPQPITLSKPAETSSTSTLLSQTLNSLASLSTVYLQSLQRGGQCTRQQVDKSKCVLRLKPMKATKLMLPRYSGACLPLDWVLLPLIQEYNKSLSPKKMGIDGSISDVVSTLCFLLTLEHLRPKLLKELPTSAKLVRLMCVFLIGNDLFLENEIRSCLLSLLRLYSQEGLQSSVDFSAPIPGVTSFGDLYSSLLEQFAAVSYGDHLFASYVVLPLQQRFSVHLRHLLWKENVTVIRVLSLPLSEVPVGLKNFLFPIETDESLLETYMAAMATEIVKASWSPLMYLVAVHHLHSAMFNTTACEPTALQRRLLQSVMSLKDEKTKQHLLLYSGHDEDAPLGFKCNPSLTEDQSSLIKLVCDKT